MIYLNPEQIETQQFYGYSVVTVPRPFNHYGIIEQERVDLDEKY